MFNINTIKTIKKIIVEKEKYNLSDKEIANLKELIKAIRTKQRTKIMEALLNCLRVLELFKIIYDNI